MGPGGARRPPYAWAAQLTLWSAQHLEYVRGRLLLAGHQPTDLEHFTATDIADVALALVVDGHLGAVDLGRVLTIVEARLEDPTVELEALAADLDEGPPPTSSSSTPAPAPAPRRLADVTTAQGQPLRVGELRRRDPALPAMHPDVERVVLRGETGHWGTSSQAVAEHRAMIQLAGGLPPGWQTIAERARQRKEGGTP